MRGKSRIKLFIGLAIALFAIIKYCASSDKNPYTGKDQHISLTPEEEIAIGLQSAPQMAQQHGGLYPDNKYQAMVDAVGEKLVTNSVASESPYQFDFHLFPYALLISSIFAAVYSEYLFRKLLKV